MEPVYSYERSVYVYKASRCLTHEKNLNNHQKRPSYFDSENGGTLFLRNVDIRVQDSTNLQPRKKISWRHVNVNISKCTHNLTLKVETAQTSEMSVFTYKIAWSHELGDRQLTGLWLCFCATSRNTYMILEATKFRWFAGLWIQWAGKGIGPHLLQWEQKRTILQTKYINTRNSAVNEDQLLSYGTVVYRPVAERWLCE
jgi:hypothetical protein